MLFGKNIHMGNEYRSIGLKKASRYGVGFMSKAGTRVDMLQGTYPAYVMVLVLCGRGEYVDCYGTRHVLGPGSCFQRFPGCVHTVLLDPESQWTECFLELGRSMYSFLESCTGMDRHRPVLDVTVTEGLIERFLALRTCFRQDSDMSLVGRLPELLDLALLLHGGGQEPGRKEPDALLEDACAFLTADYLHSVDVAGFCRRHGWGYENFRKLFKSRLGVSPHQYRIRRRLDVACALLSRSAATIAEISARLGYSSPYEFSAQFKRHLGCPPSAYVPHRQGMGENVMSRSSRECTDVE